MDAQSFLLDNVKVLKGVSKDGKPYEFVVVERKMANNKSLIKAVIELGCTVIEVKAKA